MVDIDGLRDRSHCVAAFARRGEPPFPPHLLDARRGGLNGRGAPTPSASQAPRPRPLNGRLPLRPPATLQPAAKALCDCLMAGRLGTASAFRNRTDEGALIGPFNGCLFVPRSAARFIEVREAEERGAPLSPRVREAMILSVGAVWRARFELYAHRATAARSRGSRRRSSTPWRRGSPTSPSRARARWPGAGARTRPGPSNRERDPQGGRRELGREGVIAAVVLAASYIATSALLNAFEIPAPSAEA